MIDTVTINDTVPASTDTARAVDTPAIVDTAAKAITDTAAAAAHFWERLTDQHWDIIKMIGLSILIMAALFALLKLTGYLFRKIIDRKVVRASEKWFNNGLRVFNLQILPIEKIESSALFVTKITRYALYALLLYITLPLIFAVFPQTRHIADALLSWIVTPLVSMARSFVAYLPKLLRIVIIIAVMRYILKFMRYIAGEIENGRLTIPKFYPDWAHATYNLLRIFICAFTIVLIFPLLPESESAVFRGVSVFIGVLFSIGSTSVISNMMAGLVVTYMRSFKIGDRIKVGDVYGDIVEKTLFDIRIKTVKNEMVTVPNSSVLASNVVNYSTVVNEGGHGTILYQTMDLGYDVTCARATELLVEAALKTEHVLETPPPFVLMLTLGNSAASYQINAYTKRPDLQAKILSDMNRHFFDICLRENIDPRIARYDVIRNWETA